MPSYEPLYRRARLLGRRRAEELTCQDSRRRRGLRDGTWDEFYNDFDMRHSDDEESVLTVSYGEYAFSRDRLDFDSLKSRALQRARMYFDLTEPNAEMKLVRDEWACLDTGKASRPLLAHVTMQFRQ